MSFRIKHFLKQQGLQLLPNSAQDWKVGYKFEWDKPIIKSKAKIEKIFITDFLQQKAGLPDFINNEERDSFRLGFEKLNEKNIKANFNSIDVEKEHDFKMVVNLPNFGVQGAFNLNFDMVKKMSIKGVEYRAVKDDVYYELLECVSYLKRVHPKKYKELDSFLFIEELWYATSFQLEVSNNYASDLSVAFTASGISFSGDAGVTGGGSAKFTVNLNADCPFAVRVKEVEDLLD